MADYFWKKRVKVHVPACIQSLSDETLNFLSQNEMLVQVESSLTASLFSDHWLTGFEG